MVRILHLDNFDGRGGRLDAVVAKDVVPVLHDGKQVGAARINVTTQDVWAALPNLETLTRGVELHPLPRLGRLEPSARGPHWPAAYARGEILAIELVPYPHPDSRIGPV